MTETTELEAPAVASATRLPLSMIRPGDNPRRYFDHKKHDELVASIKMRGVLQPLLLRASATNDVFTIIAGERRYKAALEAFGADGEVPVMIRAMTDQEALEAAIDENDIRDDASETEQADAAVRVLVACQNDHAEAARRLGWSPAKLDRRLALANLSDAVKLALDERRIKVGHAELLAAVPADKQDRALETIITAGLDVGKTRELLMRVTQSLAAAVFDKTECLTCPFNSASQRALFETHVDDGHCTNPGCFQLKTEAAASPIVNEEPTMPEATPTALPSDIEPGTPAGTAPSSAPAPKSASKPVPAAAAPKAAAAPTMAKRVADLREATVRAALVRAVDSDPDFARVFDATLRDIWQVDAAFLGRFDKPDLKLIAQECGLVAHMGEKAFAKLLTAKPAAVVAGMLNATGFSWAGCLPRSMTLDGKYGPPPAAAPRAYKD
jgi:ParB/RepB/Spo0J family partition protein